MNKKEIKKIKCCFKDCKKIAKYYNIKEKQNVCLDCKDNIIAWFLDDYDKFEEKCFNCDDKDIKLFKDNLGHPICRNCLYEDCDEDYRTII